MEYLKNREYKIKYADKTGKIKEVEIVPETNMNKVQMITKLKNENKDFLKLVESKELLLEDSSDTITSQEGFYIGDPCYVLSDERYDQWGDKYGYQDGVIEIDGYKFIVHGTAYGDGEYFSNINGISFGVDSGTLAVIPLELVEQINIELDHIYEGEFEYGYIIKGNEASLKYDNGTFTFDVEGEEIEIYTSEEDDDEWDEYEEDEEEA